MSRNVANSGKLLTDQVIEVPVFSHQHFGVLCHCLSRRLHYPSLGLNRQATHSSQYLLGQLAFLGSGMIFLKSKKHVATSRQKFLPTLGIELGAITWQLEALPRDHLPYDEVSDNMLADLLFSEVTKKIVSPRARGWGQVLKKQGRKQI